jgi:hypothetical protein
MRVRGWAASSGWATEGCFFVSRSARRRTCRRAISTACNFTCSKQASMGGPAGEGCYCGLATVAAHAACFINGRPLPHSAQITCEATRLCCSLRPVIYSTHPVHRLHHHHHHQRWQQTSGAYAIPPPLSCLIASPPSDTQPLPGYICCPCHLDRAPARIRQDILLANSLELPDSMIYWPAANRSTSHLQLPNEEPPPKSLSSRGAGVQSWALLFKA